ncbi:hypothetical protein NHQ30_011403 [Ciborinia camelliae]|nr:hypothetical protein NHQ30_011403 [Ciborinia camelliae]
MVNPDILLERIKQKAVEEGDTFGRIPVTEYDETYEYYRVRLPRDHPNLSPNEGKLLIADTIIHQWWEPQTMEQLFPDLFQSAPATPAAEFERLSTIVEEIPAPRNPVVSNPVPAVPEYTMTGMSVAEWQAIQADTPGRAQLLFEQDQAAKAEKAAEEKAAEEKAAEEKAAEEKAAEEKAAEEKAATENRFAELLSERNDSLGLESSFIPSQILRQRNTPTGIHIGRSWMAPTAPSPDVTMKPEESLRSSAEKEEKSEDHKESREHQWKEHRSQKRASRYHS